MQANQQLIIAQQQQLNQQNQALAWATEPARSWDLYQAQAQALIEQVNKT